MNVIRRAQAQAPQANERAKRHIAEEQAKKPALDEGELVWIGEFKNKDMRAYKLTKGDKTLMSDKELKLFARTAYERGFTEQIYEGQMRVTDATKADQRDPRSASREGQGILWYPNGSMYEGQWRNDMRHGHGYFSSHTGYKFTGPFDQDDASGPRGYESGTNEVAYDGDFLMGSPHGVGVLLFQASQPNYRYEGEFSSGLRHGKGAIFYENGDVFAGHWDMGKRHGRGITSTTVVGREMQYETEWDQDVMVRGPTCIQNTKRVKKPRPAVPFSTRGHLVAADLTKWSVKDDVTELTLEHFMKIKLGFEGLDVHGTGSLATPELQAVWGSGSTAMLEKLDADGNGTVELDEIFAAWYPNVPAHNILRFMQQHINPRTLLRIRGFLNDVRDEVDAGYLQICGVTSVAESESDPVLALRQLEQNGYKIGGERFTAANFATAKQLYDPPHFVEILEAWYPNIPKETLPRYEQLIIDANELALIKKDFYRLSQNQLQLMVEQFEEAQEAFQEKIARKHEEEEMARIQAQNALQLAQTGGFGFTQPPTTKALAASASATASSSKNAANNKDDDETVSVTGASTVLGREGAAGGGTDGGETVAGGGASSESVVLREMIEGFFKGQPEWRIGTTIRLSVSLLKDIDKFETRLHGTVTLQQLLRYCFPNVRCKRTQELLQPRKQRGGIPLGSSAANACACQICTIL